MHGDAAQGSSTRAPEDAVARAHALRSGPHRLSGSGKRDACVGRRRARWRGACTREHVPRARSVALGRGAVAERNKATARAPADLRRGSRVVARGRRVRCGEAIDCHGLATGDRCLDSGPRALCARDRCAMCDVMPLLRAPRREMIDTAAMKRNIQDCASMDFSLVDNPPTPISNTDSDTLSADVEWLQFYRRKTDVPRVLPALWPVTVSRVDGASITPRPGHRRRPVIFGRPLPSRWSRSRGRSRH